MGRLRSLVLALTVLGGVAAQPASANDVSATQAYVKANWAFVQAANSHLGSSNQALANVLHRIARECPHAASGAPQNEQSEHLSNEVIGLLVVEAGKPDRPAALRFLRAVRSLHWSSPSLNGKLHRYFRQMAALTRLSPPPVCADVRTWMAGGHTTIPPGTVTFDDVFLPNWVAAGYQPSGLSRFESGATRSLARRAVPLEGKLEDFESVAVYKWAEVLNVLDLGP